MKQAVGVIGCGRVAGLLDGPEGDSVVTHAKAVYLHPAFHLAGCFDTDLERAEAFGRKWNCSWNFKDVEEMLSSASYDLVVIATPSDSHTELLSRLLDSDVGVIICEKPLAEQTYRLENLKYSLLQTNKQVMVNYPMRFNQAHRELKKWLSERAMGELVTFQVQRDKGLLQNGCHAIDLFYFLFGGVKELRAFEWEIRNDDVIGTFEVQLNASVKGQIRCLGNIGYSLFDMDLLFQNGRAELRDLGQNLKLAFGKDSEVYHGFRTLEEIDIPSSSTDRMFYELYDAVANGSIDYRGNLKDALSGTEVLLRCKESLVAPDVT